MSKLAGFASGPVLGVGSVAGVAILGGVLYLSGAYKPSDPVSSQTETEVVASQTATESVVTQSETEVVATPEETPDADVPAPSPPSIDTFRLEPDGTMLVAGQADPDWQTSVLVDGAQLEQVAPDGQGKFVAFLSLEASDQPRVLSLRTSDESGDQVIDSKDEIIIAPVVALAEETVETAPEVATDQPAPVASDTQAVLLADETGVEVLQPAVPSDQAPEVMSSVALDAISYSPAGEVQLAGRGQGDGFVRVYLDNAPVTTLPIQDDGNWRADLPEVDTGVYTLRIDEVDNEGNVTSRVETPFKREDEAVIAQNTTPETRIAAITVQPGSTLWAISRERYGDGVLYVRVFEANRDRIRNPDLIYPGQVFTLPE